MKSPCNICDNCKYGAAVCENGARFEIDLAPGYRFKPTDGELLIHYLKNKLQGKELPSNVIRQFDIYSEDPDRLKAMFKADTDENPVEMFFFSPRDRKYKAGGRPNRTAKNGFWKASGKEKTIRLNGIEIGKKQSLGFHRGKSYAKNELGGKKTDWLMHEYRLDGTQLPKGSGHNGMKLDNFVLCKIYKKDKKTKPNAENNTYEANNKERAADVTNIHTTGIKNDVMEMGNDNFQIQNFAMKEQIGAQNQHYQLFASYSLDHLAENNTYEANNEEHAADVTNIHSTGIKNYVMEMGNDNFQIQNFAMNEQVGAQNQHDQLSAGLGEIENYYDFSDPPDIHNRAIFAELPNLDDFLDLIDADTYI